MATGQPPVAPPVTEVPVTTEATPSLDSTRFNQFAKKEADLVKQRETLKAGQTQLMTERQKYAEIQKQIDSFNEAKAKDPVAALKILGFSEKDLFNFIAAQEDTSTTEEKAAKAAQTEIQKFRDEQTKLKEEEQTKVNTQVLNQFREDISSAITKEKEKYEYCHYNGPLATDLIEETVTQVLATDGELISIQEAIEMVENYYEEEDKAMSSLKKRQPKTEQSQVPIDAPLKPQVSPRPSNQARPTLSKNQGTVASTTPAPKGETPDQKKARLIGKYFGPSS